jgi:uncharacterized protein (DUF3084 family)
MSEPVERRLSPERLSQARRVFTDYWGWHPEAVQRAGNDLLAEVDALRAELDATALDLRSHRAEVETLYGERDKWRAEVREARAERDAAAPILEAAKRSVTARREMLRVINGGTRTSLADVAGACSDADDALAALFPDDQPAEIPASLASQVIEGVIGLSDDLPAPEEKP